MKSIKLYMAILISFIAVSLLVTAAYDPGGESKIVFLSVDNRSSAAGDVFIKLSNSVPEFVDGYYVLANSPCQSEVLSFALSAYQRKLG